MEVVKKRVWTIQKPKSYDEIRDKILIILKYWYKVSGLDFMLQEVGVNWKNKVKYNENEFEDIINKTLFLRITKRIFVFMKKLVKCKI